MSGLKTSRRHVASSMKQVELSLSLMTVRSHALYRQISSKNSVKISKVSTVTEWSLPLIRHGSTFMSMLLSSRKFAKVVIQIPYGYAQHQ